MCRTSPWYARRLETRAHRNQSRLRDAWPNKLFPCYLTKEGVIGYEFCLERWRSTWHVHVLVFEKVHTISSALHTQIHAISSKRSLLVGLPLVSTWKDSSHCRAMQPAREQSECVQSVEPRYRYNRTRRERGGKERPRYSLPQYSFNQGKRDFHKKLWWW